LTDTKTNIVTSEKSLVGPAISIVIGMFMVSLDGSVLNVAIPGIVKYFGSDLSTIQWAITGYSLALAAVIPLAGWMTDRFGTKRIFMIVISLFTLGSALCSMAKSPSELILFRIIQGIGGGMVMPIGMATGVRITPKNKIGIFMGLLGVPILLAPTLGPVVSGYILEYFSWNWIFRINIPIGIIAIIVAAFFFPKFERKKVPSLDIFGMILAPIAFAMLVYGVNEGSKNWTSTNTIVGLVVGSIALIIFIFVELSQKEPLIELKVFGSFNFVSGIVVLSIFQIVLYSVMILAPLYLQNVKGYTTLQTGLILLPQGLSTCIMLPISGKLFDKIGAKPLAFTGLAIGTIVLFMLSKVSGTTSVSYIVLCLISLGLGAGIIMMPLNAHMLQAAPKDLISRVTPLTGAFQQVAFSFAIAGMTGFLTSQMTYNLANTTNKLSAAISSYDNTFLLCTFIAIVGLVLSLLIRKPKVKVETDDTSDLSRMV